MGRKRKNLTLRCLRREILMHPGRYLAITAIVGLGVGFFAGLRICSDDMVDTAAGYFDRQELFDFRLVSTVGFDDEAIGELRADPDVALAEGAYACDAVYLTEDGSGEVAKFLSVPESVNLPLVTEGRLPEKSGECALDCRFFPEYEIGSVLTISGTKEEWGENFVRGTYTVTGFCFSPLYLNYERGATNLGTGSVTGFVYLHPSDFASEAYTEAYVTLEGAPEAFTDSYRDFIDKHAEGIGTLLDTVSASRLERAIADARQKIASGEMKLADAMEALRKAEDVRNYALDRYTNIGYACFENDAAIMEGVSRVFPVFFFLVAALVCATTMTRMIAEERTQIGTMKALGYSGRRISGKYLIYAGSAALVGSAGGYALGTWLIPELIWKVYEIMYGPFAPLSHVRVPLLTAVSFAAAAVCSVGTAWITGRAVLSETPAELIRPKAPKAGKRIILEHIRFLWRRMSFLHKVSARNILRYRNRLWMMVLGIGGCCALLLTGAGVQDSISGILDVQYGRIAHYDYVITTADPLSAEEREAFEQETASAAEKLLWLHESTVDVRTEKGTKTAYMVIPEDTGALFAEMVTLRNDDGPLPYPGPGEVSVDAHLAEQLGLSPGSVLTVTTGGVSAELRVASVCENYVNSYLYLTRETYREAFGADAPVKTAYAAAPEGVDPFEGGALFLDRGEVINVTVTQAVKERISGFLNNLNYIVLLVIVCAGLLSFIVLYELTEINITERTREIATVKVLGFYRRETASYVFRENRVLTLLGALAGIPMGYFLNRFVVSQIKVDMVYFIPRISLRTYIFALLLTFFFTAVVHLFMRRRIAGIPMAESLKSVE